MSTNATTESRKDHRQDNLVPRVRVLSSATGLSLTKKIAASGAYSFFNRDLKVPNMAVTVIWPRVLGIPIPISLEFLASPLGDAQNADHFDFALIISDWGKVGIVNHEFTAE